MKNIDRVELAELLQLSASESEALRDVRLTPWGKVEGKNGTFTIDAEAAQSILAEFEKHGVALPIDVDHESVNSTVSPSQLLGAVGWIESLDARPGEGIFGKVEWSDRGRNLIRSQAFRYLSPVVNVSKHNGKVLSLHSAAIVNKPAIPKMEQLAASEKSSDNFPETFMEAQPMENDGLIAEIAEILDVPVGKDSEATLTAIRDKVKEIGADGAVGQSEDSAIANSVREALALPDNAGKDAVTVALSVRCELRSMHEKEADQAVQQILNKFKHSGRLNPNDKAAMEACRQLARSQPDLLEAIFANAPAQLPMKQSEGPNQGQRNNALRDSAARAAKQEFDRNPQLSKLTTVVAYVNQELVEKGHAVLTNKEIETLTG